MIITLGAFQIKREYVKKNVFYLNLKKKYIYGVIPYNLFTDLV